MQYVLTRACSCGHCGPQVWEFEQDGDILLGWEFPLDPHGDRFYDGVEPADFWSMFGDLAICTVTGQVVRDCLLVPVPSDREMCEHCQQFHDLDVFDEGTCPITNLSYNV